MISSTVRDIADIADEVSKKSSESMERVIVEQLGILVSEGILVIERHEPIITVDNNNTLKVEHKVRLHLRDKEYISGLQDRIETLEDEVNHWKDIAIRMRGAAKDILAEEGR